MKTLLRIRPAVSSLLTVILLPALAHAVTDETGFLNPALTPMKQDRAGAKPSPAIPWSEIGAKAGAQYQGDGLSVRATGNGAVLRCVFQKLEGEATAEGLWLTSTVPGGGKDRFRVVAAEVQRQASSDMPPGFGLRQSSGAFEPDVANQKRQRTAAVQDAIAATSGQMLPMSGTVQVTDNLVRFIRPVVVEEYSVSMDGVRQDFIIQGPPVGSKTSNIEHPTPNIQSPTLNSQPSTINREELRVELAVSGARVEGTGHGVRLVLEGSGRKIAYSRLRVTDATGRELPARMEVASVGDEVTSLKSNVDSRKQRAEISQSLLTSAPTTATLAILVNDAGAVYPVRIDPTFSDDNWISINPSIPGTDGDVYAAAVDGAGNLYIGGDFMVAGGVAANRIAKWNGSNWSPLGLGINDTNLYRAVFALAVSGSNVFAGGSFTIAADLPANRIAKWDGNSWSALGAGTDWGVGAIAVSGSDIYAGGGFTTAGSNTVNSIARWDGNSWSALGLGLNGTVETLAVSGSDLYVGGGFTRATNNSGLAVAVNYIAKWNGSNWTALGVGMDNTVEALAVSGGDVYAGGRFYMAGG